MHPDPARDAGTGHLAAWQREVGLRLAAVKAGRRQDGPFEASLTGVPLGYVRLLSLEADPVRLSRTPDSSRAHPPGLSRSSSRNTDTRPSPRTAAAPCWNRGRRP